MDTDNTCRKCGEPLASGARHGFCPKCLLLQASGRISEPAAGPGLGAQSPGLRFPSSTHPKSGGGVQFGDYDLLEEIGRGGMGVVYRARQRSLNRVVAIKMMTFDAGSSPELVKRFRTEAVSAASLHHPNIVAIHEVGVHDDRHFFVMDYVEGQSLAQLVSKEPLPATRAAAYLKTVAEAVHYAHERSILHRDLKPSNVLIDDEDQPRVVDFGLAKRLDDHQPSTINRQLTLAGQVLGSPHYLPPEQAAGQRGRVSRRTDVYALGATLYHLLTGHPPFRAESLAQTLDLVLHADPVAPRLLNPAVPVDLETICLKCLEKEPSRRYATAQAVADELGRFLAGEPLHARPLGPTSKVWRWCRRKPSLATAIGLALLSALVGVAGIALQWRRAEAQRARAEANEYVLAMNVAQQAIKANDRGRALQLLQRHVPGNVSVGTRRASFADDFGSFEWRYLWQQCQNQSETVIAKLRGPIRSLEISGDGQWLFAGSIGGEAKLWNLLSTGEPTLVAREADWTFGAFSPNSRLLLSCPQTAASYGTINVWDLHGRKPLEPIRDPRRVATMAFSPDGRWFGFGVHQPPWDRRLVVLDFSTRTKALELTTRTSLGPWDFGFDWVFTLDGRSVIFSENAPKPEIGRCDLATGESHYFPGHPEAITTMALSPDGHLLATGAGYTETAIKLWQLPSFQLLGELTGHRSWITALSFSPDGRTLASAAADQAWRLWDVSARANRRAFEGLPSDVLRLRFSADGQKVFTGSRDGTIHRWSPEAPVRESQPEVRSYPGMTNWVLSPEATRFAALQNGALYMSDLATMALPKRLPELGTNNNCLLFSPDGEFLFVGNETGQVQVWSANKGRLVRTLRGAVEPIKRMRQDPRGHILVVVQSTADYAVEHPHPPHRISLWSTAEWDNRGSWVVQGVARKLIATDGRWLAMNRTPSIIRVWSLSGPHRTNELSFQAEILAISFSADGRFLAAASYAGAVRVWQVPTFREWREFQAHARPVSALAFLPGNRGLATAGESDEAIKLWDLVTSQEMINLPLARATVNELVFSADGAQLTATTAPGGLVFWRAPSFAQIMQREEVQARVKQ